MLHECEHLSRMSSIYTVSSIYKCHTHIQRYRPLIPRILHISDKHWLRWILGLGGRQCLEAMCVFHGTAIEIEEIGSYSRKMRQNCLNRIIQAKPCIPSSQMLRIACEFWRKSMSKLHPTRQICSIWRQLHIFSCMRQCKLNSHCNQLNMGEFKHPHYLS